MVPEEEIHQQKEILFRRNPSVRAGRDTPVADYSVPGVNTTRHIEYRSPIAVSLVLHFLSISYFKWFPRRCCQLCPYVGMGWLGTCFHRDCNEVCDTAIISPRVPSPCVQNAILSFLIIDIIPSHQIYVAIGNPSLIPSVWWLTTCSYLWKYVCTADNVSHAENLQSNSCQCFSDLSNFRNGIQVTRVFRYCSERQG